MQLSCAKAKARTSRKMTWTLSFLRTTVSHFDLPPPPPLFPTHTHKQSCFAGKALTSCLAQQCFGFVSLLYTSSDARDIRCPALKCMAITPAAGSLLWISCPEKPVGSVTFLGTAGVCTSPHVLTCELLVETHGNKQALYGWDHSLAFSASPFLDLWWTS